MCAVKSDDYDLSKEMESKMGKTKILLNIGKPYVNFPIHT